MKLRKYWKLLVRLNLDPEQLNEHLNEIKQKSVEVH